MRHPRAARSEKFGNSNDPKIPTTSVTPGNRRPDNAGPLHSGPAGKQEIHKQSATAKLGIHGAKEG